MKTLFNSIRKVLQITIVVSFLLPLFVSVVQAAVIQMDREEIIQRSKLIFVGEVLGKNTRWNDKGNLIVTDYVFRVDDILFGVCGGEITLTFAGGQLPEEGQSVSDVPEFKVGDVLILMVEDSETQLFSPVTGMYQGKYLAGSMQGYSNPVAFDGDNLAVKNDNGEVIYFKDFIEMVRKEIPVAKSKPLPDRSVPENLQKYIIKDLPSQKYDPSSSGTPSEGINNYLPQPNDVLPEKPVSDDLINEYFESDSYEGDEGGEKPEYWSYSHRAKNVPIVFNPWPDSFPEWCRYHDQYAMSYWNVYADIFRVMAATGTWAWRNDRYDMAGFPSNQEMIDQFGEGWGSTTLAVCWLRWDSTGFSIEADIAVNPAFSWTTDDYSTYSNPNLYNLDRTLVHELGHSWGLEHQWYALSVMNYAPHKYRAYNVLYGDDTMAVRAAFPSNAVARTDLGVSLFYYASYQNYDDSLLSTQILSPGDNLTVSDFILENSGTATVSSPEINWYLVPNINSWTGSRYIGTTTHGSLAGDTYFKTARTLTIPSSVPPGTYYLGAYIAMSSDSVGDNNSSWLDRLITVRCDCTSGPCCDGCDFKPNGSQPTGYSDYYNCEGSNSCSGTNYVRLNNYYCNGTDASYHLAQTRVDTCGVCESCATGDPTCNYCSNGAYCSSADVCNSDDLCANQGCNGAGSCNVPIDCSDCGNKDCDYLDEYYCDGAPSPTGTNYAMYHNCTDCNRPCSSAACQDCTCECTDTQVATCGVCEYCERSGCANYIEGTSCGENMECDGNGSCRPALGCECDVSGDGVITPQDALCAFQKYLGLCPTACGPCEDICCDVNGDDNCTPADALCVFQEYLGIGCAYCN